MSVIGPRPQLVRDMWSCLADILFCKRWLVLELRNMEIYLM